MRRNPADYACVLCIAVGAYCAYAFTHDDYASDWPRILGSLSLLAALCFALLSYAIRSATRRRAQARGFDAVPAKIKEGHY